MSGAKSELKVLVGGQRIAVVEQHKNLLESLEAAKVEVHYHCRQGFCGACRCKLISGEVSYHIDPLAFIDDDEILPCSCKPITDLTLDLD